MKQASKTSTQFTGTHMLIVMLLFFGIIIGVNLTLVMYSNQSWTGLVVKNSYVASQEFNQKTKMQESFQLRGWRADLSYDQGTFKFVLVQKNIPLANLKVTGLLRRPVHERDDILIKFHEGERGTYEGQKLLQSGIWILEVTAQGGESERFRQVYRFVVPKHK